MNDDSRYLLRPNVTLAVVLALAFLSPYPPALLAQPSDWQFEVVENGKRFGYMTEQHMVLDTQGHPHIAYGGDWLYYTWYDGTTWHYEVADSTANVGEYACIALDSQSYPHISYFREYSLDLKYAYKDETGWHAQMVDGAQDAGRYNSLEIDTRGYPHISYQWYENMKYAYWDGTTWHIQIVDQTQPNSYPGFYTSLELDGQGWPHISYYAWGSPWSNDLRYASEDDSGWHKETVDEQGDVGKYTSLELDAAGYPHISYYDQDCFDLKYACKDALGWHIQTVYSQSETGRYTSLELDEEGHPHISFYGTGDLRYAYADAAGWHVETAAAGEVLYTALGLDPDGYPEISYYLEGAMKYARRSEAGWLVATVDTLGSGGQHAFLAIGPGGRLHASYLWNGRARYTYQDATGWRSEYVETNPGNPGDFGFGLGQDGTPHVFYGAPVERLWHGYKPGGTWQVESVGEGFIPVYVACTVGSDGHAQVAFDDLWDDHLVYGHEAASGWQFEVADPALGYHITIVADGAGHPHLTFTQPSAGIKYAYKNGAGWHSEIIGQMEPGSDYSSMVLDAMGRPHRSHCVAARLLYSHRDDSGWHSEDVDTQGQYSSIQLDPAGYPHIAYWVEETDNLKYAYKDASGWLIQTVDPGPGVGTWATLVLDQGWYPSILYRRPALTDVKRAWIPAPSTISLTATLVEGVVTLTWSPVEDAAGYWLYGAFNLPWFVPGGAPGYDFQLEVLPAGTTTWSSPNGVGDPDVNWTYLVIAVDASESELARSNREGEQDYEGEIP